LPRHLADLRDGQVVPWPGDRAFLESLFHKSLEKGFDAVALTIT
jgi:hypothetical protein